jgi:hypothetical protein
MSDVAPNAPRDFGQPDADTEQLALAAVDAIKHLIAERKALGNRVAVLEYELARVRDHFDLIRDSYRKLANELVAQLKIVDKFESETRVSTGEAELHWRQTEQMARDP